MAGHLCFCRPEKLWYSIFLTILVEWMLLQWMLHLPKGKSFLISLFGNIVAGLSGIFVMPFIMLFWHLMADFLFGGTFNFPNWVATYIMMCFGSVIIEALVVRIFWGISFKKLLVPMTIANSCSYLLLLFLVLGGKLNVSV
jgi:hypothetical protein